MKVGHGWLALGLGCAIACGPPRQPSFSHWSPTRTDYVPKEGSSNGFDAIALAALAAERDVRSNYLDRVHFTPKMRENLIDETRSAISILDRGLSKPIHYEFVAYEPFESGKYHVGWRLIGRGLVWRIKNACEQSNFDAAVGLTLTAHRFGFALCGGSALEASLGLSVIDEARRELAPYLRQLGAGQLNELSNGLSRQLSSFDGLQDAARNESERMMMAVRYVQESFQKGDFSGIRTNLGSDARDAVRFLEGLRTEDVEEQEAYFQGFADEAKMRSQWSLEAAAAPRIKRTASSKLSVSPKRPWRKFAQHFFSSFEPVLMQLDQTLARTRLLAIESRAVAAVKASRSAPSDLSWAGETIKTDPFTGKSLHYSAVGSEFKAYSVGPDLADDGGTTDESFTSPDLTIERPVR